MKKLFRTAAIAATFISLLGLHSTTNAQVWVNGQRVQGISD